MLGMHKISNQLISLVFVAFVIFAVGVSSLIGYQSYHDMEDIALERVQGAANLFNSEFQAQIMRTYNALTGLEVNRLLIDQLILLNNYGPLYSEDASLIDTEITQAQTSYYFQSQLQLARASIHLLPLYELNFLALYQTDPFSQFENAQPLPSIVINHHNIWFYRYFTKSAQSKFQVYSLPIDQLDYEDDFFNVSTIYQEDSDYFYKKMGAKLTTELPFDYLNALKSTGQYTSGQMLNLAKDKLNITIWSPISLNLVNPETWQQQTANAIIMVGTQTPTTDSIQLIAERIGTDLAIVDDEHAWVSSIDNEQQQQTSTRNLSLNDRPYVFSEVDILLNSDDDAQYKVMALSSTENLEQRIQYLIIRLSIMTLLFIGITGGAMYLLIRIKLRTPLDALLKGVNEIQQGNFQRIVNVNVKNEFATLSQSFNQMTKEIEQKSNALQHANDTLEQKVMSRTDELKNAQQQLILSEKMASLGQLVAGVAHEINTPLGNSITALSFIHDTQKKIKAKFNEKSLTSSDFGKFLELGDESMGLMESNLRKASELVHTFKNVAVNQSVEELIEFSIWDHVNDVLTTLRPQLKKTKVRVILDIDKSITIKSYPGAYYHIISNMITNSLKHAFPDKTGNIHICFKENKDSLHLEYSDDGQGMEADILQKIFDPFYTTKRGEGGTGLGLYMTYNIVTQRLGGEIEAKSQVGEGTHFSIDLPLDFQHVDTGRHHFSI